ncbi:MAG: hypothetical protein JWP97_20 [Labilithrix sp.]|nr:hypothetical protein [Labilithrix sp.]
MPKPAPITWNRPFYVGIDENGMGPRLGPLVVTSVLGEDLTGAGGGAKLATSRPRGAIARRIGDSKKLLAFDDGALGEAWARAIARHAGFDARTPAELLVALLIDPEHVLRAPCPSHHVDLCWSEEDERFATDDAAVAILTKDLAALAKKGLGIRRARVAVVCTKRLNEAVTRGESRFDVDLHAMERLTLAARHDASDEVYALCGKVGGFDFYGKRFGPLAGRPHTAIIEGRARSEYVVPGVGRLAFLRDADDTHLLVGLASLVGKWVRDHLMRRVVRYHRVHDGAAQELAEASGYHDPVTTRFIAATTLVRKERRVDAACFERLALGDMQGRLALGEDARPVSTSSSPRKPRSPTAPPSPEPLALPGLQEPPSASPSLRPS